MKKGYIINTEKLTERRMDRMDRLGRWTNRWIDVQKDRETHGQTDGWRDKYKYKYPSTR